MSIDSNNQQAICLTYYYSARYLVNDEYFIPDMQQIDSKTGYKARLYYSFSLKYIHCINLTFHNVESNESFATIKSN